jgi:uncharacterized protein (DUF952 family)
VTEFIFHITSRSAWEEAQKNGKYESDSLRTEGFIHSSRREQVLRVANAFYHHQQGLVILKIDLSRLQPEVRWEAGTDKADELFPHLYGPLNLEAVKQVITFDPLPGGMFTLPEELK